MMMRAESGGVIPDPARLAITHLLGEGHAMTPLIVLQDCGTIQLPKGLNTLVDADIRRLANALTWGVVHSKGERIYAIHQERRGGKLTTIKLHQFVADPPNGLIVDHKNGDTLDNRRSNLRIATKSQNGCNARRVEGSSKYKGVSYSKATNKWVARITKDRRTIALGYFPSELSAADAYDAATVEHHGEFGRTNHQLFPDDFD
jgi:hypothetical protein